MKNIIYFQYVTEYGDKIKAFGHALNLRECADAPSLLVNPGVGADQQNILLLTDAPNILFTDVVELDDKALQALVDSKYRSQIPLILKGDSRDTHRYKMHEFFYSRLEALDYTITNISRDASNLICIQVECNNIKRNLYYLKVDHQNVQDNARVARCIQSLEADSNKIVYLQKALEPYVTNTPVYRDHLRNLRKNLPHIRFIFDGSCQYDYYQYLPGDSIKINVDNEFCYGNQMWRVECAVSEESYLNINLKNKRTELEKLEKDIKSIDINSTGFQLLVAFKISDAQLLKQFINSNQSPAELFVNMNLIIGLIKSYNGFEAHVINKPMAEAIEINSPCYLMVKHMHKEKKPAAFLWDRIGLKEAYQFFLHDKKESAGYEGEDQFWKNRTLSLMDIYKKLLNYKLQLEKQNTERPVVSNTGYVLATSSASNAQLAPIGQKTIDTGFKSVLEKK